MIYHLVVIILCMLGLALEGPRQYGGTHEQAIVRKKYAKLGKIARVRKTYREFCSPHEYSVQPQQRFAGEYMAPSGRPREILIYHKIGAGKTCLAIQICEKWVGRTRPLVLMPASLIPGFRNELRSPCASYASASERAILTNPRDPRYRETLTLTDSRIAGAYDILSYNQFLRYQPDSELLVVDEVQNINNQIGKYYRAISGWIERHPNASIVLMSGTPLFDNANELSGLAQLLRIRFTEPIALEHIPTLFAGKISYFAGAPSYVYPNATITIQQCVMSAFQARWYMSAVAREKSDTVGLVDRPINNNFYICSRQRSNITYPQGLTGTVGYSAISDQQLRTQLATYSTKFAKLLKRLSRSQLAFIYSEFRGYAGIMILIRILRLHGYSDLKKDGPGRMRYAVWSGSESQSDKDRIRAIYNSVDNDDGSQLQIVIGSPSIKEGVTLLRTRQVHVLEAYWNYSRLEQIFGRALRYCSHSRLPAAERTVEIYIYAATTRRIASSALTAMVSSEILKNKSTSEPGRLARDDLSDISIDLYMLWIAHRKWSERVQYLNAMADIAVDRYLWS